MYLNKYDVIVVGAGHAGVEAASAAARMGAETLLFVIKFESIARMSCNPTIGGPAKGHLAKEIDALGGLIGKAADSTGIQFRMLNRSKGPAVWAPRCQNDRGLYTRFMTEELENTDNLLIMESTITDIIVEKGIVTGVRSHLGQEYYAPRVIICAGTFLRGRVFVGDISYPAGRAGEPAANELSGSLEKLGLHLARFKTGTPPRIDLRTADISKMDLQPGDENPEGFTFYRDIELKNLVDCYLTWTNPETHKIISDNLAKSSLYGGFISGTGPRYCPSLEDKVVKFKEKEHHHVFIEPEGLNTYEAYVNGVSNSLPPHVQNQMIASITGLEKARIMRYGYAIEYDYVIPDNLKATMETKKIKGLYLAGQINGTSGYEEAAAQGIAAGINAVLSLDGKTEYFDRSQSYLGVLLDDLVTKGTNEPYRLFTSRSEYRLYLRQDNSDDRMMPTGYRLGLVSEKRWQRYQKAKEIREREIEFLMKTSTGKHEDLKEPTRLINLLKRPQMTYEDLEKYGYTIPADLTPSIRNRILLEVKYEGYFRRQLRDIERFERMELSLLPEKIDYMQIDSIAWEAREKLNRIKPASIGQAARIPGINSTDINALIVHLKKNRMG
ncbi:MAG: tRNA uridine-5-carboxymethylaminomethyl(34) synthesis enzyme MnmG [Candidatus Cloacimonetes bacterium]|nr:tRNA uridine-5-carboxymethylaminomethyl(34) synthesis enzyme MnmG [Candidatus Cloacimonadota bacterium]